MEQESFSAAAPVAEPRAAARFTTLDLAMLGVVFIWGLNFVALKVGLAEINTLAFAGLRFLIATLTMIVLMRVTRGSASRGPTLAANSAEAFGSRLRTASVSSGTTTVLA